MATSHFAYGEQHSGVNTRLIPRWKSGAGANKGALPQTKLRVLGSRPFIASITSNQGVFSSRKKAWCREAAIMRIRQTIKLCSVSHRQRRKEHFTAVTSFAFMRTAKLGTIRPPGTGNKKVSRSLHFINSESEVDSETKFSGFATFPSSPKTCPIPGRP